MIQNNIYDAIGTPCLVANRVTLNIFSNKAFVSLFGYFIENAEQLFLLQNPNFNLDAIQKMPPDTDYWLINASHHIVFCMVKIRNLSEEEIIICFEKHHINEDSFPFLEQSYALLQKFKIGIILYDLKISKNILASPYILEKSGYTIEELKDKPWNDFIYPNDLSRKQDSIDDLLLSKEKVLITEGQMTTKKGKFLWVQEMIEKIVIGGNPFLLIYLRDKTKEKESDAELARAKQKTENAELLKSIFLDNIPHEIRTPLNAIIGFTSLLRDVNISQEERSEYINFIQDSSNDIMHMVDNMIEIAKLQTNQALPKMEKCLVNKLLDRIYESAKELKKKAEKESISITTTKAFADPSFSAVTDPEYVHRIFLHLIDNALKFTSTGKIEIGYKLISNIRIDFYVSDTGIGISQEEQDVIFQKFGKSGNINTDKNRGAGLGLSLSKEMIRLLGGEIHVESKKGEGSTFSFSIPIEPAKKISIEKHSIHGEIDWSTKTILIAEDNSINYNFLDKFLRKTHVNLIWAKNGKEAIEMFKENKNINLILMDILMPEIDGFDATKEIRKIDKDIPIIAQTALAFSEDEELCYQAGCNYVLVKPINSDDLTSTIRKFMR